MDCVSTNISDRKKPGSSIPSLDDLLDELLTEILIRTPVDTVHRCKSISKRWFNLISNPSFVRQYLLHRPKSKQGIIYSYFNDKTPVESPFECVLKFSYSFLPRGVGNFVRLLGSFNGLVLCGNAYFLSEPTLFYICNPVTQLWVELPLPPPELEGQGRRIAIGFICDEGNYVDPQCKVAVFYKDQGLNCDVKIGCFSTQTRQWSVFHVSHPQFGGRSRYRNMVACNRMLHGLLENGVFSYDPYEKPDEVNFIHLPKYANPEAVFHRSIGVIEGKIFLSHLNIDSYYSSLQVWEMEDYSCHVWHLKHNIHFDDLVSRLPRDQSKRILKEFKSFKIIDSDTAYIHSKNYLILWNLKTKMAKILLRNLPLMQAFPFVFSSWPTVLPKFS